MSFAVIETGGKQYKVAPGQRLKVEKLETDKEGSVVFGKVLLVADDDKVEIGRPYLEGKKVEAKIIKQDRRDKVIVFKYKSKTRQTKKKGHRQHFTEVEITAIK